MNLISVYVGCQVLKGKFNSNIWQVKTSEAVKKKLSK